MVKLAAIAQGFSPTDAAGLGATAGRKRSGSELLFEGIEFGGEWTKKAGF